MSIPLSLMNISTVEQFFVREKAETRKWLLSSMDTMLNSVFSQLSRKFIDCFNVQMAQQLDPMIPIVLMDQMNPLNQINPMDPTDSSTGQVQIQPIQQSLFMDQNMNATSSSLLSFDHLFINSQLVTSNNELPKANTVSIKQEINDNHEYEYDFEEEEEDCACNDCINGGIHQFKEEDILDDDDDDATTILDDDDDDTIESNVVASRTRKRQKIEDKQPVPILITLSLRCLQSDCDLMFDTKEQLNAHLLDQHQVALFRCLFKDCRESFDTRPDLSKHIKSQHSNVSILWPCGACPKQFRSYAHLTQHIANYHQLGYYVCSAAGCGFSGPNRGKIHTHHQQQHKAGFRCQFPNCAYQNKDAARVKDHERKHLGVKPYRCRWPDCGYARSVRDTTMKHIKRVHFGVDSSAVGDPKDYLEVVRELM